MPKVSVVIPVYNTEEYLERCMDSVVNQTLADIEIICLNDCSTDNSLEILKKYASNDSRINIIDLSSNYGAANARNIGIKEAGGEFIAFLDSDDYLESEYFYEKLYNCATENEADISKGAYKNSDTMTVDESINEKIKENKEYFCYTYCSAIFKSKLIKENSIKFPELRDMEDPVFTATTSKLANKVVIVDDCNVIITMRDDSITGELPSFGQVKDKIKALEILFEKRYNSYVLAYWFVTVVLDSLKNFNLDIEEYVLYKCSQLFEKLKNDESFIWHIEGINREVYEYFCKNKRDYYFDEEELKKEIDKHDVISFDIFDTLLLRPFVKPKDLFLYMQDMHDSVDFAVFRSVAEKRARILAKKREDINFDEIYNTINPKYKNLKQIEKDLEFKFLQPNNEMLKIYNYALSKDKKVIIASDMYLDKEFLIAVLNKNGIKDFYKLYVSSEVGKCKYTGNLYKHIINDIGVNANKILHIGDNYSSDYVKAKEVGLDSYYYKKIIERLKNLYNNYSILITPQIFENTLYSSTIVALQLLYRHNNRKDCSYFENLGFALAGVLGVSFVNELQKVVETRKLTDLFFIARDGYMLKEIYDKFFPNSNVKTHYIYAQRKLNKSCLKLKNNPNYDANSALEYKNYINSIKTNGKKIGIVDTCAGNFSAQSLIENYMPNYEFVGVYMATTANYKYNYINLSINSQCDKNKLGFPWDLIELLFTSEEPPIESIVNKKPVYRTDISKEDLHRIAIYKEIKKGINEFASFYLKLFDNQIFYITVYQVFDCIKTFWKKLNTVDMVNMNKIKHPIDTKEQFYISIMSSLEERSKLYKKLVFLENQNRIKYDKSISNNSCV